ncbi:type I restriction-modification system, specificity subunit S [Prevotella intermedia]|uniref:Type I restriction-modification system, specificity subunit S n=1 Tax=Prevotella intermedia TaxID=28131 RepID=A0AAD1F8P6_PREIN|nr:type I restriction modification DNA specificity domain protein [Prevotella intermedia 17]APW35584.1 restriction endonuclease subunit S [Prevotella intermedia]BAR97207.1 type I restriction-modification system, specificity subunit S [Prevotella intermedia]
MAMAENKEKKVLNVPNLRFPEFQGEWQEERLADIADLSKGIGISKEQLSADGEPCILYGELYTKYKSETIKEVISKTNIDNTKLVKSKANDVIIPCSGETAEEIATARCVLKDDILLGGDLNIIRLHGYDGSFMSYQLNGKRKYDIAKVAQGVSVVHLYGEHLKNIKTINPSLNEQKKIANLLSLLDERISTQNKIIEDLKKLKYAISKYLFERKDLFETKIKLSKVAELKNGYAFQSSKYNALGKWKILTIANVAGERYVKTNECNCIIEIPYDIQKHQKLEANDILISLTGNVGRVSLCTEGFFLLNQRVGLLQLKISENRELIYQVLSFHKFEKSMIACAQGAAQMNISKGDVENYILPYSFNKENINSVASVLKDYDKYIINEINMLSMLHTQKQHLLRQMFI